jgi:hypothetical protein
VEAEPVFESHILKEFHRTLQCIDICGLHLQIAFIFSRLPQTVNINALAPYLIDMAFQKLALPAKQRYLFL